jgi:hypothetical protein
MPLSERKMWLATTGREFDEEVIEQLAVTPKFVVRGEVLPSYGQILPATSEVGTAGVARQQLECTDSRQWWWVKSLGASRRVRQCVLGGQPPGR